MEPGWEGWTPETTWLAIQRTFNETVHEVNRNAINALKLLQLHEAFWEEWEVFHHVTEALNGFIPNFAIFEPPEPAHVVAAVTMVDQSIRTHTFGDEVARYIAGIWREHGLRYSTPFLPFAQPVIKELYHGHTAFDNDIAMLEAMWPYLEELPHRPDAPETVFPETSLGVEAARMLSIKIYLAERQTELERHRQAAKEVYGV